MSDFWYMVDETLTDDFCVMANHIEYLSVYVIIKTDLNTEEAKQRFASALEVELVGKIGKADGFSYIE